MQVIFFNTRVRRFLESLELSLRARADHILHLLEEYGSKLGMPHSKPLGGGLFELRIVGGTHIRFVYTFHKGHIWILHGFIKKTGRISGKDLEYARRQLRMLLH